MKKSLHYIELDVHAKWRPLARSRLTQPLSASRMPTQDPALVDALPVKLRARLARLTEPSQLKVWVWLMLKLDL